MCRKNVLTIVAVVAFALSIGQVQADTVTVTNGDFETIYKPNSTTITGQLSPSGSCWNQGVGPNCPIQPGGDRVYDFSDESSGTLADIAGWLGYDKAGWIALGGTYGRDQTTGNLQGSIANQTNHTTGGANCYLANGGSWGNSAGGLIVSETSLGNIMSGCDYTLSMYAKGAATPVVLKLLANGTVITPTSSVSPTLSSSWQEFSRTYDYEDLTSYVGQAITIVCGIDRDASGTQTLFDDVSLAYSSTCPPELVLPPVTGCDGLVLTDESSIDTQSEGIVTNEGEGIGGTDSTTVGDGESIDILDSGCFQLGKDGEDFALSFWLKPTGGTQIIGTKGQYGNTQGFIIYVSSNSIISVMSGDGINPTRTVKSSKTIQLNEWNHIVVNYTNDGDDSQFEINVNLAEASGSAHGDVYNSDLRIGDEGWGTISSFDVCIFQSWSRVLTRNEKKALYFDKASSLGLSSAILSSVMSDLMDHLTDTTPLTGTQIEALTETFVENATFLDVDLAVMSEAFTLVDYYEANEGPLFINEETDGGFPRVQTGSDGYELARAIFTIQQEIHDRIFEPENCQDCQAMLDGKIFETSDFFPGECDPPANPETTYEVDINATNPEMWGKPVCFGPVPARRPTGCYLAPGSIGTVTVPSAMVDQGFEILVGGHAVDKLKFYKSTLQRFDRVAKFFPITSTVTSIANPFGGGVYIMVPYKANLGSQTVEIANVVQAPFFSATSAHQTTLQEWTNTERLHDGPWADFESDKFMMTLPTSWIYAYADPVSQMDDWDLAMDGFSELLGFVSPSHNIRNLVVLYVQPDISIQHSSYGVGYPQINTIYNPDASTDGNSSHFFLTNILDWHTTYHECGHCQLFSKFPGHEEATVNLPYVYIAHEKFGVPLVDAFTPSTGLAYLENIDVDQAALTWFVTENFRNGNPMDISSSEYNEVRYQHRGYGMYVDIGELFGWDVISDFYYQEHLDYINPPASDGLSDVDSRIFRLSKAVGYDMTPLIHCWGVHPVNPSELQAAMETEELEVSQAFYNRLVHYKDIIPADNAEFWDHYLTIYPSEPEGGNPLFQYGWYNVWKDTSEEPFYDATEGTAAKAAMQDIIDLYYPDGYPVPVAYWQLDGDLTDETMVFDATAVGTPVYVDGQNGIGQALQLNGLGATAPAAVTAGPDLTVAFWMKADAQKNQRPIGAAESPVATTNGWLVMLRSYGKVWFRVLGPNGTAWDGGDLHMETANLYQAGTWVHMAFTFDESLLELKGYINGVLIGTNTLAAGSSIGTPADVLRFGVGDGGLGEPYTGLLDEVVIWDTVLTDIQIQYVYENDPTDTDPPTPNPATFASAPAADSSSAISMTATTGSDATGPVEYFFDETSGNPGATDSGWTTNPVYNDTGLAASTQYTYTVEMRDSLGNTGTASSGASATTDPAGTVPVAILGSWVEGTSHTVESGTDRALIFIVHAESSADTSDLGSVTYGGQAMTKVVERNEHVSWSAYTCAFILDEGGIAAASGSTFSLSWNTSPSETPAYTSLFLENVNQTTLVGATGTGGSTATTAETAALSNSDGDMAIVAGTCGNDAEYSTINSFIEAIEVAPLSADGIGGYLACTGTDVTPGISHTNVNRQSVIGFVVQAD